jgi:hypothetical protein
LDNTNATPEELSLLVLLQVESQFSRGSLFVLGRLPNGIHMLFRRDGKIGKGKVTIISLLSDYTSERIVRKIWDEHVRDCADIPETALVLHGYGIEDIRPPS